MFISHKRKTNNKYPINGKYNKLAAMLLDIAIVNVVPLEAALRVYVCGSVAMQCCSTAAASSLYVEPTAGPLALHGDRSSICCCKLQSPKCCFKVQFKYIRPSPCPSQAPHGSACKVSPPYIAPFPSLTRTDAKRLSIIGSRALA